MSRLAVILLTLAFLVLPLDGAAQPAGRVYRLGLLSASRAPDPEIPTSVNLVPIALRDLGYVEGRNLVIERLPALPPRPPGRRRQRCPS